MDYLDEKAVLDHYVSLVDSGAIPFLARSPRSTARIRALVIALRDADSLHARIQAAKSLWKDLFEASMTAIDPDRRGYDALFAYFDRFVEFEELIFASDAFYRDHTLHCLWVYFLGEWTATRPEFAPFARACERGYVTQRRVFEAITGLKGRKAPALDALADRVARDLRLLETELELSSAQRCVAALCHDLGYPLKKIAKINKAIAGVLPAFSIRNFAEFSFDYTPVQLSFIDDFLRFVCLDFRFASELEDPASQAVLARMFRVSDSGNVEGIDETGLASLSDAEVAMAAKALAFRFESRHDASKGLRYTSDFEQYEHGVMSAFLLMKTLEAFRGVKLVYSDFARIDFSSDDFPSIVAKRDVLVAIIEHTNAGFRIGEMSYGPPFLVLMDELEEFSRISRAAMNRQFVEEFCKTRLTFEDGTLKAEFVFDDDALGEIDPAKAFKGKARRVLSVVDVARFDPGFALSIRFVGATARCRDEWELRVERGRASLSKNGAALDPAEFLGSREFAAPERD